jgi:hypothetical protein
MTMTNLRIRSELAPAVGLASALLAFGIAALGAPIVLGQSAEPVGDSEGPATPRTVVASGDSRYFGRWEIVSSQTANGDPCVGVRLLEGQPGSGPSLAEGCGPTVANQVGTLVAPPGKQGTLWFGRVDSRTATGRVSADAGRQLLALEAIAGRDGRKYVVAESAARLRTAQVRLSDGNDAGLGRADAAAVAGRQ